MSTVKKIMELVTSNHLTESLVDFMEKHFEDFPPVHQGYQKALQEIEAEFDSDPPISAAQEKEAICQQIASVLRFSFYLGVKANYDHFVDPVARTFLEVDAEVYLRENTAKMLPEYLDAQERQNRFYAALSHSQRMHYQDVTEFVSYLETVGPKLAHYIGYQIGNQLFPRVIPGYHGDFLLTTRYNRMMEKLLGLKNMSLLWGFDT